MLMEMISVSEFLQPLEIMVFLVASDLCRPPARHLPAIALAQARPPARRAYASESGRVANSGEASGSESLRLGERVGMDCWPAPHVLI